MQLLFKVDMKLFKFLAIVLFFSFCTSNQKPKEEDLDPIIDLTEDKQNTIVYFLNPKIQQKLPNFYFYDKSTTDIYVDQHIILIKKNNLHLEDKGIIISINGNSNEMPRLSRIAVINMHIKTINA